MINYKFFDRCRVNYLLSNGGGVPLLSEPEATFAGAGRSPPARHCSFALPQRDLDRLGHCGLLLLVCGCTSMYSTVYSFIELNIRSMLMLL